MNFFSLLIKIPIFKRVLPSLLRNFFILIKKEKFKIVYKNLILETNIRDPHDREIYFTNQYEEKQFQEVFHIIKKNKVEIFLDVGANVGIYSLLLAKNFRLNIVAFEPVRSNYNKFLRNIENNKLNKNIETHNLGLSNKSAILRMKTNTKFGYMQSAGYHVSDEGQEMAEFVKADELLNYKNKTIYIKIDTEGHEQFVLEGAIELIKNNNIFLQIEIWDNNFNAVKVKLKSMSFDFIKKIKDDYFFKKII